MLRADCCTGAIKVCVLRGTGQGRACCWGCAAALALALALQHLTLASLLPDAPVEIHRHKIPR
jgi:hypothetical protein